LLKIVPYNNYAEIVSLKGQTGMAVEIRVLDVGKTINLSTHKEELDSGTDSAGNMDSGQPLKDTDGVKTYSPFADVLYARAKGVGTNLGVKIDVLIYRRTP
jgi:hypothetical protein